MSYRRMPDRLYDDPDELAFWAREALAAAGRGGAGASSKARRQKTKKRLRP
jgi:DNA transformation protein